MGKVVCKFCGVACTSPRSLCEHVLGQKHRALLARISPEEAEQLGRLQYFIDTYMKSFPVLGLDYVQERQVDSSYHYACLLCNKDCDWLQMVTHLTDPEHTRVYIQRHHSEVLRDSFIQLPKEQQVQELREAAQTLHCQYGHSKIRISAATADEHGAAGGKRNGDLPSTQEGPPQNSAKGPETTTHQQGLDNNASTSQGNRCSLCRVSCTSFAELSAHLMGVEHRQNAEERSRKKKGSKMHSRRCTLCNIHCSSILALSEHVVGSKHRKKVEDTCPLELSEVGRLGHFLDTYMMDEPILGLEYIVEFKLSSSYKYTCQLCNVNGKMQRMVAHLTDGNHMHQYIKKHHSSILHEIPRTIKKMQFVKAMKDLAARILERQWSQYSQVENSAGSTRAAGDSKRRNALGGERGEAPPSRHDDRSSSHARRRPLPYQEERHDGYKRTVMIHDGPPPAKRGRHLPEVDQEPLPSRLRTSNQEDPRYNKSPATQDGEFHTNDEFLQYLANFKINDCYDVDFIRKITQNCIKALKIFREEEAQGQGSSQQPEAPMAHTGSTDRAIPDTSVMKAESPSEALSPKNTSTPISDIMPKSEVTDYFFSSIKNMHESEVVGIFQKIAATNPEFQGMNIPAVIRYLKESGKLNTP